MRYDRPRFLAYGLPAAINLALLILAAFSFSFRSGGGVETVVALVLAAISLLQLLLSAVRRGRDLGWSPPATVTGLLLALPLMPLGLILIAALTLAASRPQADRYGAPLPRAGAPLLWTVAAVGLLWPWLLVLPFSLAGR